MKFTATIDRLKDTEDAFEVRIVNRSIEFHIPELEKYDFILPHWYRIGFEDISEFKEELTKMANKVWKNLDPKEATSEASDYDEYYDNELDNNGSMSYSYQRDPRAIRVTQVYPGSSRVFRFTKRKMESFIYDLQQLDN